MLIKRNKFQIAVLFIPEPESFSYIFKGLQMIRDLEALRRWKLYFKHSDTSKDALFVRNKVGFPHSSNQKNLIKL